jgi:hypothetical protein
MTGRSVSAVDNLPGDSDCLQLSLSGCEAEKQTTTIDVVPKHYNSQLPSPALSNPVSPENKPRAPPGQYHEVMFEGLPSEAACCGEQTRALTVSASHSPTTTPSIAPSRDASTDCENNNISVLPRLNLRPQRKGKQLRSKNSPPGRVLRSQLNTEPNRRDRPPSVAVVIPVRRSTSSMAGTSRDSLVQPSRRRLQASPDYDGKDPQTSNPTKKRLLRARESDAKGEERPQKRRQRDLCSKITARNRSVSPSHAEGCIGASQATSGAGFFTGPGEAQEIFGRAIIRIQPHGPRRRHAYFLTFLPDVVDRPLSCSPPGLSSVPPPCTERATYTSSKASAPERGNVRLARRRAQTREANPKARNNRRTHQENSRKGMPWLPEEEELLVRLKRDQGLRWSDVTRLFSEQYPGRTQGSIQVYWTTNLSKRSP